MGGRNKGKSEVENGRNDSLVEGTASDMLRIFVDREAEWEQMQEELGCHRAHFQLHFYLYFFHPRRLSHTRLLFGFYEDTNCYDSHDGYVPQADYK